jgi:uncharacterized membrane protein
MPFEIRQTESPGAGHRWTEVVLVASVVAMALVAGLNYTFSVAVMPNLAAADDRTFVETVQRFNQNPVFPLTFTVALVLIAVAVFVQRRHGAGNALRWTIAALALYGVVLAITGVLHIPLNAEIDGAGDPDRIADLTHVRKRFEGPWVAGNIVRTVFCAAAVAALGRALLLHIHRPAGTRAGDVPWPPPPSRP